MSREIRSPVYQIDFTAVDAGKRIATTKRRIRWRFGFTNQDALAAGGTGTECRGEEHDITFIWSITSGKRLVLADGQEVHYSNSRSNIFDFSWTMRGNHVLKVTAHANAPINAHPNFRQYDFFVDGMSFFSMPKVYRLGLTDSAPIYESGSLALAQSSRVPGSYGGAGSGAYGQRHHSAPAPKKSIIAEIETPNNADEEEAYLKEAIKQSLSEVEKKEKDVNFSSTNSYNAGGQAPASAGGPDLLIDFMSEPGPVPAPAPNALVQSENQFAPFAVPQQPATVAGNYNYAQPTQMQNAPVAAQVMAVDPFAAPPPSTVVPGAGMSTVSSVASASYTNPPPPVVPTFNNSTTSFPPAPLAAPPAVPEQPPPVPATPAAPVATPNLTMAPQNTGLGSDANDAFQKFANMDQFDLVKPKVEAENPFDSPVVPTNAPPPAPTTLADMKAMNDQSSERKEIMKPNAMVVSSAQNGNWGVQNTTAPVAPYGAPAPMMAMGQQQQPMMGGQGQVPMMGGYGYQQQQQPMMQQQQYQQPPTYGQQQGYGAPQF